MMFAALLSLGFVGWGLSSLFDGSDSSDDTDDTSETAPETTPGTDAGTKYFGTNSADRYDAGDGDDIVNGGDGSDSLSGGSGNDEIDGGLRTDVIAGEDGDDTLRGGRDSDLLYGNDGNDTLEGGNWHDLLIGGAGEDLLEGGSGDDLLMGGFEVQKSDGSGYDYTVESTEAFIKMAKEDPDLFLKGTSEDKLNSSYFKGIDLDEIVKPAGLDGVDTLIGGDGEDTLELHQGDIAWGGSTDGNDTSSDTFNLFAEDIGAPAEINDWQDGLDKIQVDYELKSGVPHVTVEDDGGDSLIKVDGNTLAVVRGAAGTMTYSDLTLVPKIYL